MAPIRGVCPGMYAESPPSVRRNTVWTCSSKRVRSGVTRLASKVATDVLLLAAGFEGAGLLEHRVDPAHVQERLLGHVVEIPVEQDLEGLDGLGDGHGHALETGEHLTDVEGLREEALDLAGPVHDEPVLFGQF